MGWEHSPPLKAGNSLTRNCWLQTWMGAADRAIVPAGAGGRKAGKEPQPFQLWRCSRSGCGYVLLPDEGACRCSHYLASQRLPAPSLHTDGLSVVLHQAHSSYLSVLWNLCSFKSWLCLINAVSNVCSSHVLCHRHFDACCMNNISFNITILWSLYLIIWDSHHVRLLLV